MLAPIAPIKALLITVLAFSQQTPPQNPAPVGPSTALQRRAAPPARIVEFRAQPASIKAGEPITLIWATENPDTVTITPEPGRVSARGSRQLFPKASTVYMLRVTGPNGEATSAFRVTVAGSSDNANKEIPRNAGARPDLTGVYSAPLRGTAGAAAAPLPRLSSVPATPKLKPGAEQFKVVRPAEDVGQYAGCLPPGVPQVFSVPYFFQIVQSPRYVVILYEYLHLFRVIPIDGTPLPADPDPFWMGHSIGRWEGDTLVVDSTGFNDKTEINGYRHTESLHVVERFRKPDADTLQYQAVIEDPNVFEAAWAIDRTFTLRREFDVVDEFVCENNRDYRELFQKK